MTNVRELDWESVGSRSLRSCVATDQARSKLARVNLDRWLVNCTEHGGTSYRSRGELCARATATTWCSMCGGAVGLPRLARAVRFCARSTPHFSLSCSLVHCLPTRTTMPIARSAARDGQDHAPRRHHRGICRQCRPSGLCRTQHTKDTRTRCRARGTTIPKVTCHSHRPSPRTQHQREGQAVELAAPTPTLRTV